jgi:gas vesicle structural protein
MVPLIPNTDDLISLLDRVLDKGITIESWVRLSLFGCDLIATDSKVSVASSSVYVGYGKIGTWRHDLDVEDLFLFRRRDLLEQIGRK